MGQQTKSVPQVKAPSPGNTQLGIECMCLSYISNSWGWHTLPIHNCHIPMKATSSHLDPNAGLPNLRICETCHHLDVSRDSMCTDHTWD